MAENCIFIDMCKFYRGYNRYCHDRDEAHQYCGQAREKLREIKEMKK